jgi:acetolactate synthase-1/2/3 large subunit
MRIDHHALFKPLTKATFPLRGDRVADVLGEALILARAEPPGPVHLDLPEDVSSAEATEVPKVIKSSTDLQEISAEVAKQISRALGRARKPLVLTGLAFTRSAAGKELLRFIEKQKLPFVSTLHAKGHLPESHPNWVGVLGRARRTNVQDFIRKADLILAIGYDPIEINYEEWVGETSVVHVSTEPAEVSSGVTMLFNQGGDLDGAVRSIGEIPSLPNDWSAAEWAAHRRILDSSLRPDCQGLGPHHVLDVLRERLPRDGILAYDVGAHTHQIATQWRTDLPRTCLSTNGWSSMGYGMPAAYAAKLVHPDRAVVGVVGDGCFQMTAGELAMARRLQLAVPIIVLNDGWLGLIKVKQERKSYGLSGVRLGNPPDSPAHYFGVPCRGVRNERELKEAIDWGLKLDGPSVIEAFIDVEPYSHTVCD